MRPCPAAFLPAILLCACAGPAPYVAPVATGKASGEVARLVAASEAKLFPCSIMEVAGMDLGGKKSEVTLLPGRQQVTLHCSNGYHVFKPQTEVVARGGKSYVLTGYLIDDSITIFNMKMRVKVGEVP